MMNKKVNPFRYVLLTLLVFHAMAAFAGGGKTKLSIDIKDATLVQVFTELAERSQYTFTYGEYILNHDGKYDAIYKKKSLAFILTDLGKKADFDYLLESSQVVVRKKAKGDKKKAKNLPAPQALSINVTGQVTDEDGKALPGASVQEKGTTNGTTTDIDGNYKLTVSEGATLLISFIGYKTQEIAVGTQTVINVKMQPDVKQLEELVVIGYGTQKKSDVTGAVASVALEEIQKMPIPRVDQALQGRVPGVLIQNNSSAPNASVAIRIRGPNSITGGNGPLVVIDGFQNGNLNTLNPEDIQSIEVLKDASATAVYGSRGANGVILVNTKTGRRGKATVALNTYVSLQQVSKKIDLLSPLQYARTINLQRAATGGNPVFKQSQLDSFEKGAGTNWQDAIFRDGLMQNYNLSVSAERDKFSYFISGDFLDNRGVVLNSSYKRYLLRTNMKAQLHKKIALRSNLLFSRELDHPVALNSFANGNEGSPIYSALLWAPTKSIYKSSGNYTQPGVVGPATNFNPVALAKEPIRNNSTNRSVVNLGLAYDITAHFTLDISGGYRLTDEEEGVYLNSKPTDGTRNERAWIKNSKALTLQNTNQLTYANEFNDAHSLTATAVFEQQYERYNDNWGGSDGFLTNASTYHALQLGEDVQVPYSSASSRSLVSYMGRIHYGYKSRYLLTATIRADGSSVFGKNNKWGYFPSVALAWNATSEPFMENHPFITHLKARASYGVVGSQAISAYQSLPSLSTDIKYGIDGGTLATGIGLKEVGNPNLKWEQTAQMNFGIDMELLDGRIAMTMDYYDKLTRDLLLNVPLPQAGGGDGTVLRNVGSVSNKGIELGLTFVPIESPNFLWESQITFAKNQNKVVKLNGDQKEMPIGSAGLPGFENSLYLEVGQPIGLFRGLQQDGVWKTSEKDLAAVYKAFPGTPKFVDQNKDNVIDSEDIVRIGSAQPEFIYGWNNSFSYKGLDLNVFFQGVYGNDIYNISRVGMMDRDATSVAILDRWTPENQDTQVPSFKGSQSSSEVATSRWIEDGSYLRIKNVTLGYTFSNPLLEKIKIQSLRLYASGINLFTFTRYAGFDPEATTDTDTRAGIDLAAYPAQEMYTLGLNAKF